MLPRLEYIDWIEGRPERAAHDLATTDLVEGDEATGAVVPTTLEGLEDPPASVTLEDQVAAAYGVDESRVVTTAGATHAYVLAVLAALDADDGDRVLVELPGYEPLRRTPEVAGATVDRFRRPPEDGFALVAERVAAAAEEDTSLVAVSNRHNPSGRLTDRDVLAAAAEAARAEGARLLVDEVYAPFTTAPVDGAFGGPTAAGLEAGVVVGSLTKFHGLGGLRIGWVVADRPFLDRVERARSYVPVRADPSVALARRALANADRIAARRRERLRENHDLLVEFVEARPDLTGPVQQGAPFAFLAHESADGDAVLAAAEERDLLVVPGRFFEDEERFRVSLGGPPGEMEAALDVLGEALDAV